MDHDHDLGPQTAPEKTKGNLNQSAGKEDGTLGEVTRNKRAPRRATEREAKGALQEGVSRAKEAVADLTDR